MIGRVVLIDAGDRHAHDETVEDDVLHTLELWRLHNDPARSRPGHESLRSKTHAGSAMRPPHIIGVTRDAEMKFVDRGASESLRVAK